MARPLLLDLFSGAGGAAVGYHRAGFDVVGVDIRPQPRYPFRHVVADAMDFPLDGYDAIHASPPCQAYTPLGALHPHIQYPDLVAATRARLEAWGGPWVIENVMSAPLLKPRAITLCGSYFGLRTYRHRRFEPSRDLTLRAPQHFAHLVRTATSRRRERWSQGWHVSITGDVGTYVGPEAMGIDWMTGNELCQAIPPAYTQFIGERILDHLAVNQHAP